MGNKISNILTNIKQWYYGYNLTDKEWNDIHMQFLSSYAIEKETYVNNFNDTDDKRMLDIR